MFLPKWLPKLFSILVFLLAFPLSVSAASDPVKPSLQSLAGVPLNFEQHDLQNKQAFLSRGMGYQMWLTPDESVVNLQRSSGLKHGSPAPAGAQVRMKLLGANPNPAMSGVDKQIAKSNYFIGNDKSKWKTDIENYAKVKYEKVYPGIDLVYYGNQQKLEYDFLVRPGTDYKTIRMNFEGADQLTLDEMGNLILKTATGDLVQHAPIIYQEVGGERKPIEGHYVLMADNQVGFEVADYDSRRTLVIDPVLEYASYFGGSLSDYGTSIHASSSGEIYLVGYTGSSGLSTTGAADTSHNGSNDVLVLKLDATGALVYSTYIGGSGSDLGSDIKTDSAGAAYIVGNTSSTDFPINSGDFQDTLNVLNDVFIIKLNSTGSALEFSSYFGGSGSDYAYGIDIGSTGEVYFSGNTDSTNFPSGSSGSTANGGGNDIFITKMNPLGTVEYSNLIGGTGNEQARDIVVDTSGAAYVTGYTNTSSGITTTGPSYGGGTRDGLIIKLNPAGSALVYATYLGGSGSDDSSYLDVNSSGNVYVTGATDSVNFPTTTGAFTSPNPLGTSAFVTKLSADGSSRIFSTIIGGNGFDGGYEIKVGSDGRSYVAGVTISTNFPTANPIQAAHGNDSGGADGFIIQLDSTGANLEFATYMGGSGSDSLYGMFLGDNKIYALGHSGSTNLTTANPLQANNAGATDMFIAVISDLPGGAAADTTAPVISVAPTAITLEAGATYNLTNDAVGVTALDDVDLDLTASIVRGGATLPLNTTSVGSQGITYNVSDAAGNAAVQQSRTINVVDTTVPTCTPPADIITPTTGTLTTVAIGTASGTDATGIASIVNDAPTGFLVATTTVNWTVTDNSGLFSQCTQSVTVTADATLPVIFVNQASVNAEAGSVYTDTGVTASDDVDGDLTTSIVKTDLPVDTSVVGTVSTLTYNVSDSSGNAAVEKSRTVTIVDPTGPVCTAPADITTLATGTLTPVTIVDATATDFVGVTSITRSPLLNEFQVGITLITFTATDAAGNIGTCTQNIIINTIVAPFKGALITRSAESPATSIDIPDRTMFHVPWNVVVYDYDPDPFFSPANPEVLKVPAGVSKIRLSGNFRFENLQNDDSYRFIYIVKKNDPGSITAIASTKSTAFDPTGLVDEPAGIDLQQLQTNLNITSPVLEVLPGDEFEVLVYQNSGQVIPLSKKPQESWFSIEVIE